jgi:hypothetical protein
MTRKKMKGLFLLCVMLLFPSYEALAVHPLISDEAETLGRGKAELEVSAEFGHEREGGVTENSAVINTVLTYGLRDDIDVVLAVPYERKSTAREEGGSRRGIGDIGVEVRWKFLEKEPLYFALKPAVTLPTGDDDKGLGTGRMTYGLSLVTTIEVKPWELHLNGGYVRSENRIAERRNIWRASLGVEYEPTERYEFIADVGVETNPVKGTMTHPAFLLFGFVYYLTETLGVDMGIKVGLNGTEVDRTFLVGITVGGFDASMFRP